MEIVDAIWIWANRIGVILLIPVLASLVFVLWRDR